MCGGGRGRRAFAAFARGDGERGPASGGGHVPGQADRLDDADGRGAAIRAMIFDEAGYGRRARAAPLIEHPKRKPTRPARKPGVHARSSWIRAGLASAGLLDVGPACGTHQPAPVATSVSRPGDRAPVHRAGPPDVEVGADAGERVQPVYAARQEQTSQNEENVRS